MSEIENAEGGWETQQMVWNQMKMAKEGWVDLDQGAKESSAYLSGDPPAEAGHWESRVFQEPACCSLPTMLSHQRGARCGKQGLVKCLEGFRAQLQGPLVNSTPGS